MTNAVSVSADVVVAGAGHDSLGHDPQEAMARVPRVRAGRP